MTDSMPERSLFAKAAGGAFWTGLGAGGQAVIQFVVLVVLARLLTPEDFGIVAAAMVIVGLSAIFSLLGVGPAIVQRPNLERRHIRTAFTMSLVLGGFFFALVWIVAPYVEVFFRMEGLTEILRLVALVFPIKGFGVISESLAQRKLRFKFLSAVTLASFAGGYGAVGIIFASLGYGPYALAFAYLGQAAVMTALLFIGHRHSVVPSIEVRAFRELMYFGSGYTIARVGNYAAIQGDNLVVGRFIGASGLGLYGRAYQLMMIPVNLIGTVFHKVLFPSIATIQDDLPRLARLFRRGTAAFSLVMFPMSAFFVVFASELVLVVLGPQWTTMVIVLQIFAGGLLFRAGYKMSDTLASAMGAVYERSWRQWVYAGAVVSFAVAGTHWGIVGVAVGVTVGIFLNYILMAQLGCRLTKLSWHSFLSAHIPGFVLGLAALSLALLIHVLVTPYLNPGATILVAGLILLASVGVLWRLAPKFFLGRDGAWFFTRLVNLILTRKAPAERLKR